MTILNPLRRSKAKIEVKLQSKIETASLLAMITLFFLFFVQNLFSMEHTTKIFGGFIETRPNWSDIPLEIKTDSIERAIITSAPVTISHVARVSKECNSIIKSDYLKKIILIKADEMVKKIDAEFSRNNKRIFHWTKGLKPTREEIALKKAILPWIKNCYEQSPDRLRKGYPYSPLHVCAATKAIRSLEFIYHNFKDHCDFGITNLDGDTPLEIALYYKSPDATKFFLQHPSASIDQKKNSILSLANTTKDPHIIRLVKQFFYYKHSVKGEIIFIKE